MAVDLAWYRKYRPRVFEDVLGCDVAVDTIESFLSKGEIPQTILLEGDSGCGKTTLARLIAKALFCENPTSDGLACDTCNTCLAFDTYLQTGDSSAIAGLQEVNMSDQNGKDDIDTFIEDMAVMGIQSNVKVYIFDECHKATDALQNKLLKLVEEPPKGVILIFCTTNSAKIIPTLLNRIQCRLEINKPTTDELDEILKKICVGEGIKFDLQGLHYIERKSKYSVRQAINYLNQTYVTYDDATIDNVLQALYVVDVETYVNFIDALKTQDAPKFVSVLYRIKEKTTLSAFIRDLKLYVVQALRLKSGFGVDDALDDDFKLLVNLFKGYDNDDILALLDELATLKDNDDLELNLLLWGYKGLVHRTIQPTIVVQEKEEPKEVKAKDLKPNATLASTEVTAETVVTDILKKEEETAKIEQGLNNVDNLTQLTDIDDAMNYFSGATVVNS